MYECIQLSILKKSPINELWTEGAVVYVRPRVCGVGDMCVARSGDDRRARAIKA